MALSFLPSRKGHTWGIFWLIYLGARKKLLWTWAEFNLRLINDWLYYIPASSLQQNPAPVFCHLSYEGPEPLWERPAFILHMEDKMCRCYGHTDRSKQERSMHQKCRGKTMDHWLLQFTWTSLCLDYLHWLSLSWCCSRTFVILEVFHFNKLLWLRWYMEECRETSVLSSITLSCSKAQGDEGHCPGYICVLKHGISSRVAWRFPFSYEQFCWHVHFAEKQNCWHTQCDCRASYTSYQKKKKKKRGPRLKFVFLTAFYTDQTSKKWWNQKLDNTQNYWMDTINYARC